MSDRELPAAAWTRFKAAFTALYKDFRGRTVSEVSLTRHMMLTIRMAVDHGMLFEKGMYPIIKSLMYLDGMVLRCRPDTDLIRDMKPYIETFKKHVG